MFAVRKVTSIAHAMRTPVVAVARRVVAPRFAAPFQVAVRRFAEEGATEEGDVSKPRVQKVEGAVREIAVVKYFDSQKGFGFLAREDGTDLFVHHSSIQRNSGRKSLPIGQPVEIEIGMGPEHAEAHEVVKCAGPRPHPATLEEIRAQRPPGPRELGVVKEFDHAKGKGKILRQYGKDVLVHWSAIDDFAVDGSLHRHVDKQGRPFLVARQRVQFELAPGSQKAPKARKVAVFYNGPYGAPI